jgi:hypothetical protein
VVVAGIFDEPRPGDSRGQVAAMLDRNLHVAVPVAVP